MTVPYAYHRVHRVLSRLYGRAGEHQCAALCGSAAQDWAFIGETDGRLSYSDDVTDYAPLCRKCHAAFDRDDWSDVMAKGWATRSQEQRDAQATAVSRSWEKNRSKRIRALRAAQRRRDPIVRSAHAKKAANARDPEKLKDTMRKMSTSKRKCAECEYLSSPGNVGKHQKKVGHTGVIDIR